MTKRMIIMLIGVVILFGGVLGWHYVRSYFVAQAIAKMPEPAQTVATMESKTETWHPTLRSVGSLRAVNGVDVTTEIGGMVKKIDFQSGGHVEAGDLLVQLRVSADKATLEGLKASEKLAQINYERDRKLIEKHAISTSQLQQDASKLAEARSAVAQQKAQIDKKTISAPFSGELGVRQVDLGQYVSPGTTVVTLQSLHPLYIEFSLPQNDIDKIDSGQEVMVTVDGYPGKTFSGKVNAIEPKISRNTRNFRVQATIPNKNGRLRPGMFVNVEVALPQHPRYVTLPRTAIAYNTYGDYVYIVEKATDDEGKPIKTDNGKSVLRVRQQVVTTGPTRGDQVAVLKGLEAGQQVVVAGQINLHDGAKVRINNDVLPPNNPAPEVPNG